LTDTEILKRAVKIRKPVAYNTHRNNEFRNGGDIFIYVVQGRGHKPAGNHAKPLSIHEPTKTARQATAKTDSFRRSPD
jgi:hypothetical protein